ncbi:hypothetical protein K502DRAFT_354090 [Neoconidiobolus thromboides FSU 785]|nr:hypothetical protein K502DRAFT_354090 [Neoconidiobolus thromboides FSU 785]
MEECYKLSKVPIHNIVTTKTIVSGSHFVASGYYFVYSEDYFMHRNCALEAGCNLTGSNTCYNKV